MADETLDQINATMQQAISNMSKEIDKALYEVDINNIRDGRVAIVFHVGDAGFEIRANHIPDYWMSGLGKILYDPLTFGPTAGSLIAPLKVGLSILKQRNERATHAIACILMMCEKYPDYLVSSSKSTYPEISGGTKIQEPFAYE